MDFSTSVVIGIVAIFTALIYLYKVLTKNFGYWESISVPCEKGFPVIGSEWKMFLKPIHEMDMERTRRLGRMYGTYFVRGRIFNVIDPEILKQILVKDFPIFVNRQLIRTGMKLFDQGVSFALDDDWKRIRSIISPTFSSGKMRKMAPAVLKVAKKLTLHIGEFADNGKTIITKNETAKFSAEVLGKVAFGIEFDPFKNPNHPFLKYTRRLFEGGARFLLTFILITVLPRFFYIVKNLLMRYTGFIFFRDVAIEVIKDRRNITTEENKPVDFLQLMLDAKDENLEADKEEKSVENGDTKHQRENDETRHQWTKSLTEDEIVAQCTTFLFAGHDSIATAIAFAVYDLAMHPDLQDKLLREVDETWEKNGDIDYDSVQKMTYLNAVMSESLRKHPLGIRMNRQAREDYTIPDTDIVLPKKTLINVSIYALHHDPEFFPDPEKFDPDRFLPENKDSIKPYTYMPFADGPRNCVAMRFAQMEIKLCLAFLLRYIKFEATEETKKPLEYVVASGLLTPKKGIVVQPVRRRPLETM